MKRLFYFLHFSLLQDLHRRSSISLALSTLVIAVSIAMCSVLFSFADQVKRSVEAEMIKSGAANALEVAARHDSELGTPWSAPPIGTTNAVEALDRLVELLRERYGQDSVVSLEPFWTAPGFVYVFLMHPDMGGKAVPVGMALTSPTDPEGERVKSEALGGTWITDSTQNQLVLPKRISDQLWRDTLFVGEKGWIGLTENTVCAEVEIVGIFNQTQRGYCYTTYPVAQAIHAENERLIRVQRGEESGELILTDATQEETRLQYNRAWIYFRDRATLLRARRLVDETYRFQAKSPFDQFEGRLRLATTAQAGAWTVLVITLGAACGSIFCTFLAWVSRRRYEIALLKAQGSGNAWVAGSYILQSSIAGLVAGLSGVFFSQRFICPNLSTWITRMFDMNEPLILEIPLHIAVLMVTTALSVALIAALIPAYIAARQDPWEILREAA